MGAGQRSLGCLMCRKRKIGCDLVRPKCSACVRSKLQCGDWPSDYAFEVQTVDTFKPKSKRRPRSEWKTTKPQIVFASPEELPEKYEFVEDESSKRLRKNSTVSVSRRQGRSVDGPNYAVNCHRNRSNTLQSPLNILNIESPELYRIATIAAMQKEYIPKLSPGLAESGPQFENGPAATGLWLSSSFALIQSTEVPVLQDALLAMSIIFLTNPSNETLKSSYVQRADASPIYSIALRRLQFEINNLDIVKETQRLDACLLASIACAWYEMLGESSLENMRTHMAGVGALLQQLGVQRIKSKTALAVLAEYRMTNIWSCFQLRQAGFLSSEEWLYRSWGPDDGRPLSRIQVLLDIAYSVPPAMEAYDKAVQGSPNGPTVELELFVRKQLTIVTAILNSINVWAGNEACIGRQRPSKWSPDVSKGEYFAYNHLSDALAWIYYFTIKMVVIKQLINMKNILISRDVYEKNISELELAVHQTELSGCAEAIFESMEYFFEDGQGYAGPAVSMVPFLIAYRYTAEGMQSATDAQKVKQRLAWCGTLRKRYIALGFPV